MGNDIETWMIREPYDAYVDYRDIGGILVPIEQPAGFCEKGFEVKGGIVIGAPLAWASLIGKPVPPGAVCLGRPGDAQNP